MSQPVPRVSFKQELRFKKEPNDATAIDLTIPAVDQDSDYYNDDGDDDDDEEGIIDEDGISYYEDSGFKIKQVSNPTVIQRTLNDLYVISKTKYLKLDPEYQREVVWDELRSSCLIASVFQGYFIPPVIFNVIKVFERAKDGTNNKVERHLRICVDGKQRLTSVQKFMEGLIGVLDSSHPPKKWYYCNPTVDGVEKETPNHNILPDTTKAFFRSRTFCCYEYEDLNEDVEENMFQLVQRGMPLTPAEKMRALSTKWATFTKQYEQDYPMVVNLCKQGRASGFRSVITIFCQILEVMSPSGNKRNNREGVSHKPILQSSPAVLTKLLMDDASLDEGTKAKFKQVFDKFQHLIELSSEETARSKYGFVIKPDTAFDPAPGYLSERGLGHVKTFSPIELITTAVLLSVHMGDRTDDMLLGDIKEMRHYFREEHKDLRINQVCWTTAWNYVDNVMFTRRGGTGTFRRRGADNPRKNVVIDSDSEDSDYQPDRDGERGGQISRAVAGSSTSHKRATASKSSSVRHAHTISSPAPTAAPAGLDPKASKYFSSGSSGRAPARKRGHELDLGQTLGTREAAASKRSRAGS